LRYHFAVRESRTHVLDLEQIISLIGTAPDALEPEYEWSPRHLARQLAQLPVVRIIILFGSIPRLRAHEYSDLDILIVVV